MITKRQFLRSRRPAWRRFQQLVTKFETPKMGRRPVEDVAEYSRLFREISNDLAVIRSRAWGEMLVEYLNGLATRGHKAFYRSSSSNLTPILTFLLETFPRRLRAEWPYFLTAAGLFFLPLAIAWIAMLFDPELITRVVPAEQAEMMESMYSDRRDEDEETDKSTLSEFARFEESRAMMAGFYIQHNVGIALQCFGRGLLFAIGTIHTLLYNGIAIGSIGGFIVARGHGDRFLSFVISHGSFELTAIAVAGAGGLMIGDALIHRGQRTLLDALQVRGLAAVELATGAAAMLVIAAFIEGFWSPLPIPSYYKYAVGSGLWLVVLGYLGWAGTKR